MFRSKNVFTKIITGSLLIALLSTAVITGCGKKEPEPTNSNNSSSTGDSLKLPFEKTVKFRVWENLHGNASAVITNFAESELNKELEKKTNVKMEYIHPVGGNGTEQFNLMIASGDLPDFIAGSFGEYQGGRRKAFEDGILIDLKEAISKYAPDLTKIYKAYPDLLMDVETEDGKQLFFPFLKGHERVYTFFGGFMRKDWLEELGLKVPETIDEMYTALKAFKEKKGVDAPFTGTVGNIKDIYFTGAWGINQNHFIENGKVVYGAIDPRFKEYA